MEIYLMDKDFNYTSKKNNKKRKKEHGHVAGKFLQFPVLPSEYEISVEQNNTTVDINSYGEVTILGKRKLKTISIASFFPKRKETFIRTSGLVKPKEYISTLQTLRKAGVCRLILTGTKKINMLCTINSFAWGEQDGTGDVFFSLEIMEYRKPSIGGKKRKKVKKKTKVTSAKANKDSKTIAKTATNRDTKNVKSMKYTVRKGDTLCKIAKRYTGSSANYRAIANQNNIKNPNLIYPGQKLVIKV